MPGPTPATPEVLWTVPASGMPSFAELGLPTPNLSTAEHNPHSPLEWTCLEEMETAVKVLVELAQVWANG